MTEKATMTLNLAQREMDVLEDLATDHDMSKTAVMRQALRLYQCCHLRITTATFNLQKGNKFRG